MGLHTLVGRHREPVPRQVMLVFGTRPEAIKMAPLVLALRRSPHFEPLVVVTGQHREMLDPVLELFSIEPIADLAIMSTGQTLADITVRTLNGLEALLLRSHPDVMVVQGDTTAALTGALAAFYHRIPVVHLEAGLRSGNPLSPYPEEGNRKLLGQLATLHLAPTRSAADNLLREAVPPQQVVVVGNTVIDALIWAVDHPAPFRDRSLESLDDDSRRVMLVTAHRRESWGAPMRSIGMALSDIARAEPDLVIVVPIHRNPAVRQEILPALSGLSNVWVREPLDYGAFARLMARADILLSDSGGIQEEGPTLGKPVLVLRDTTERPEAIAAGSVRLVGTDRSRIVNEVHALLHDEDFYRGMAVPRQVYGDGRAADRSVAALSWLFDLGPAPEPFVGWHEPMVLTS